MFKKFAENPYEIIRGLVDRNIRDIQKTSSEVYEACREQGMDKKEIAKISDELDKIFRTLRPCDTWCQSKMGKK